jgi:murein DD-endopeptidase MepM/ murein hydrolase activator NlpD
MRDPSRLMLVLTALLAGLALAPASPPAAAQPLLPTPSRWPLDGVIHQVRDFEPPPAPWARGHRGIDLAAEVGQPVLAAADGTITFAGPLAGRGVVVVEHGRLRTTYEPVSPAVHVGSSVRIGQRIATVSAGAHCTRPCLHWGLLEGRSYLDPTILGRKTSQIRLLSRSSREVAEERAALRAAAAEAARLAAAEPVPTGFVALPAGSGLMHPVPGPVTSGFGMRFHPILKVWKLHDGTDFKAACGTPVVAAASGRVSRSSFSRGYGHRLFVDHGRIGGRVVTTAYNHAQRYVVAPGQTVRRGQLLGYVGSTGYSTGCHLHLMVWLDGQLSNPMTWLPP